MYWRTSSTFSRMSAAQADNNHFRPHGARVPLRAVGIVAVGLTVLGAGAGQARAGCANPGAFTLNLEDSSLGGLPKTGTSGTSQVDAGTVITFTLTKNFGNGIGGSIKVLSSPGGVDNGKTVAIALNGTATLTATASGDYTFEYTLDGGPTDTVNATFTATCGTGGGGGGDEASGTDAEVQTGDAGRLGTTPGELPDTESALGFNPDPVLMEELERLKARAKALEKELATTREYRRKIQDEIENARAALNASASRDEKKLLDVTVLGSMTEESVLTLLSNLNTAIYSDLTDARKQGSVQIATPHTDRAVLAFLEAWKRLVEIRNGGKPSLERVKKVENVLDTLIVNRRLRMGQLERLAFEDNSRLFGIDKLKADLADVYRQIDELNGKLFPVVNRAQPLSYSVTASSQGVTAAFNANGQWTRLKITLLNGPLGRGGVAFNGQFGLVGNTTGGGALGGFVSLFAANTSSATLGTSNAANGLGLGVYYKVPTGNGMTGGVSASFERSTNAVNNGTGTGNFMRSLGTVDASLSRSSVVGGTSFTTSAGIAYRFSDRGAYVDSTGTTVAARVDTAFQATLGLSARRVIVVRKPSVRSLTLSGGLNIAARLGTAGTITFGSGATITDAPVSAELTGQATWLMRNGGIASLGAGVSGIGSSVLGYSVNFDYRLRF